MGFRLRFYFPLAFLLLAASCGAAGHWENQKLSREQWAKDEDACNRKAYAELKKEIANDPEYRDFGMSRGDELKTSMARYRAGKSQDGMIASCMQRLGYKKVGNKGWF